MENIVSASRAERDICTNDPFRDRLTGRTPRSERGGRGSTPCPGVCSPRASSSTAERSFHMREAAGSTPALPIDRRRIAQAAERLSDTEEAAGSTPAPPIHVTVAQPVERSLETRGAAGSIPAGHITLRLRSSSGQSSRFLPGDVQVRGLPGSPWKDCHWRGIPPRKRLGLPRRLGGSTPSPSALSGVVELVRRAVVTREIAGSIPAAGALRTPRLRGRTVMTPGSQPGSAGSTPAGGTPQLAVGEQATPPTLGVGDRRFDSCRPDLSAECQIEVRITNPFRR